MPGSKRRDTKSTVFLSPEHRNIIRQSGMTVQRFFRYLLDLYVAHDMGRWREGHLYHKDARMVFMRANNMNRLLELLPDPYTAGRILGEETRRMNLTTLDLDGKNPSHRRILLEILNRLKGWGVYSILEPDKLMLESPAFTSEAFVRGFAEGAMGAKLRTIAATATRMIFQFEKD